MRHVLYVRTVLRISEEAGNCFDKTVFHDLREECTMGVLHTDSASSSVPVSCAVGVDSSLTGYVFIRNRTETTSCLSSQVLVHSLKPHKTI